ncbi:MAG: hypothetical protein HWN68_11185 [Desulfobacterales bacterium]|nr:hypothetical protein [Desulfobacterales bacterium]
MKIVNVYRCIYCNHKLKVRGRFYRSPCPKCNGPMEIDRRYGVGRGGVIIPVPLLEERR